jgi:hypothetical protein
LAEVGREREAFDKMQQGKCAAKIGGIEAGMEGEPEGFVGRVRSEINETGNVVVAGFPVERPEGGRKNVLGALGERVERGEAFVELDGRRKRSAGSRSIGGETKGFC